MLWRIVLAIPTLACDMQSFTGPVATMAESVMMHQLVLLYVASAGIVICVWVDQLAQGKDAAD